MNAISLVIDRWHAGYLGCYGNHWIATPQLDRIASEGHVFDQATIDSPCLKSLYRAYWRGLHALAPAELDAGCASLPLRLRAAGVQTTLLTDEPAVVELPLAEEFDEIIRVDDSAAPRIADDLCETRMAQLMAAVIDWLRTATQPFVLWIHAQGMQAPWDAPLDLRARYVDEDSVQPYPGAAPPQFRLPVGFDPDEVLPIRWAYAGQVTLLDECVGGLLDYLRERDLLDSTLLAIVGARGFPLGEHRRIGAAADGQFTGEPNSIEASRLLYEELIHVPWLMRMPGDRHAPARSQALVQPADLSATLLQAAGADDGGSPGHGRSLLPLMRNEEEETRRDRACCLGPAGERSLRTRSWRLRWNVQEGVEGDSPLAAELFVKPDDRWEVSNVADRRPELIEPLQAAFTECLLWHRQFPASALPPLPEAIVAAPE